MGEELERVKLLLGEEAVARLKNSTVLVAGVGGVGSYAAEALARTGIGHLILVDKDTVALSNLNRQIMADHNTVDVPKVTAMHERIKSFNTECEVTEVQAFLNAENIGMVRNADFVVDAIDTVTSKLDLIEACHDNGIPFVSSLGMGNRLDSSMVTYTDLWKTQMDPLA
ncbi:MAG: ThiF family adenylyltransferase, partial [Erysipelotrichaceae bacterium]|nr:ThiF family adenylyltransferase [Erysipelotrichaceae bacterium]